MLFDHTFCTDVMVPHIIVCMQALSGLRVVTKGYLLRTYSVVMRVKQQVCMVQMLVAYGAMNLFISSPHSDHEKVFFSLDQYAGFKSKFRICLNKTLYHNHTTS